MSEFLFNNGTIHTMDSTRPLVDSVLVRDDRIVAVGSLANTMAASGTGVTMIDLQGGTLMPGFIDSHVHIWKVGQLLTTMLDVRGTKSFDELDATIRDFAEGLSPRSWFEGRGYNEALLAEKRHPTRDDLDAVLGERPGFLIRTCAHIAVANSAALRIAGINRRTPDPPGGVIERDINGEPTGVLHETAVGLVKHVMPAPSCEDYEQWIVAGCLHLRKLGITSATDPAVHPELMEAYRALDERNELPIRVNTLAIRRPDGGKQTYPLPEKLQSPFLHCTGVKFFADGGLSGATAALRAPYRHAPLRGVLRFETNELFDLAAEAHQAGFLIGTHAIGDAAIDQVLGVYDRLESEFGPRQRHRVEHLGLPDKGHLDMMGDRGWIAVPQAIFLRELGENFRRYLTDDYLSRAYPLRDILNAGITTALSSDAPVVRNASPLAGIEAAIEREDATGNRIGPDQSISVAEALYSYTCDAADVAGRDDIGRIVPGARADLVVLGKDPMAVRSESIGSIRVYGVWLNGAQADDAPAGGTT